jgi:hypothetical protein
MDSATIKLPAALEKNWNITIQNCTGYGDMVLLQEAPKYVDGKWLINILLKQPETFPRKCDPGKAG